MSNVIINDTNLINIANAIREKTNATNKYKPNEMADAILGIKGGSTIIPPEAGTLIGIVVTKLPNKIDYNAGETINLDGLEVTSQYDNGVTGIVTDACTIEVETPLVKEKTKVLVTYEGFSTSFTVNVYSQPLEVPPGTIYLSHCNGSVDNELSNEVTLTNTSTAYTSDGKFHSGSIKGTSASANYSVVNDSIPTRTELKDGTKSITVEGWFKNTSSITSFDTFLHVSNTINIQYKNNNVYNVSNITGGFEAVGDPYYNNWVHVAAVVKDGIIKLFVNGKKLGEGALGTSGGTDRSCRFIDNMGAAYADEILISTEALYEEDFIPPTGPYGGKRILQKIIVETPPTKTDYLVGETFSLDGAVIKAVYSDGTQLDITSECAIVGDGVITESTDFIELQYTYNGITKNVFINIGRLSE